MPAVPGGGVICSRWPYSRLHTVHLITMPVTLAGGLIFSIGLVVWFREPAKTRQADSPDE